MAIIEARTGKHEGVEELEQWRKYLDEKRAREYADPKKKEVRIITPIKESKWLTKWVGLSIIGLLTVVIILLAIVIGNQNQFYKLGNQVMYRTKYEKELEANVELTKRYLDLLTHRGCPADNTKETTNEGG